VINNRTEQKTTGTEITHISLASQMVYPPASRLVINFGAGNIKDSANLKTSIRGSQQLNYLSLIFFSRHCSLPTGTRIKISNE